MRGPSLLEEMVDRIEALPIADADLEAAGTLIADSLACIIGAQASAAAGPVLAWGRAQPGSTSALAFVFAALAGVLEMDAMHVTSSVHPGAVVVPAALAAASAVEASGVSLARAVLRGTEAAIRIGRSTGMPHRRAWQSTATCGGMGAALACAGLFGLTRTQSVDAIANVGSAAGGLWAFLEEDTLTKQWHCGRTASDAIVATQLAATGLSGPHRLFDSRRGFHAILCDDSDPAQLTAYHGHWQIHDTSFKPWPSPRPTHAAITAALAAYPAIGNVGIERVALTTFGTAIDLCNHDPVETEHDARFSLRHCTAVALRDGAIDFDAFERSAIVRQAALVQRITVAEDPSMTAAYPARSQAAVEVRLSDGTTVVRRVDHARGDPLDPLGPAAMRDKQATLVALASIANGSDLLADLSVLHRSTAPITALLARGLHPSKLPIAG